MSTKKLIKEKLVHTNLIKLCRNVIVNAL